MFVERIGLRLEEGEVGESDLFLTWYGAVEVNYLGVGIAVVM